MKSFWKNATPITCLAVLSAAAIGWRAYRQKVVERKLAEEASFCRARAEQGDAKAEYELGRMYYYGNGVPKDDTVAVRWGRKAADQGYAKAENGIASMYYYGYGVPQDYAEALRWYRKAADQGNAKAQDDLGSMYYYGKGVPSDYAEALRWYRLAADQGLARAEYECSYMYFHGYGVPRDHVEAHRWFRKAADHGDEYARRTLGIVRIGLTKSQLVNLSIRFLAGLIFSFGFLLNRRNLRDSKQRIAALVGFLCLFTTVLSWYGHTPPDQTRVLGLQWILAFEVAVGWRLICLTYLYRAGKKDSERTAGRECRIPDLCGRRECLGAVRVCV
jgi:hypothetical protein